MILLDWVKEKDEKLNDSFWDQIMFVRDKIPAIFADTYEQYKEIMENIAVVSTHTSRSIKLPVCKFDIKKGNKHIIFAMRNNFYDWKFSIDSNFEIIENFGNLIIDKPSHSTFEGFEKDWIYEPYELNRKKFSIEIRNNFHMHTFLWLINRQMSKE